MDVLISRLHHPVTVLGPGRRAGIWFQGCTIRCPGCVSLDTWAANQRSAVATARVLDWLHALPAASVDGVTISGGEPTDQPDALAELLRGIAAWRASRPPALPPADVLVFTGREPDWLDSPAASCLAGADAVVAGPFVAALAGRSPLRGSDNQELVTLTDLGHERYAQGRLPPRTAIQVEVTDDGVWMVGIPLPGDLAAFEAATAARGVTFRGRSWRT
jgi:anaerobic ribonucleoside-triphosphate reductase activating protein